MGRRNSVVAYGGGWYDVQVDSAQEMFGSKLIFFVNCTGFNFDCRLSRHSFKSLQNFSGDRRCMKRNSYIYCGLFGGLLEDVVYCRFRHVAQGTQE